MRKLQAPTYFNGDDALVLTRYGEVIDIFGKVGEDPGSAWTDDADAGFTDYNGGAWLTNNHTLQRKATCISRLEQRWEIVNCELCIRVCSYDTHQPRGTIAAKVGMQHTVGPV